MNIRIVRDDEGIAACFSVLRQLRPNLDADTFVEDVRDSGRGRR